MKNINMKTFLEIIDEYDLNKYVKYILKHNKANYNEYHNFYHIETMIERAYIIALECKISIHDMRLLLVAILFHDFNHSGGEFNDSVNIQNAIHAFLTYSTYMDEINEDIIDLIKFTEYPYNDDKPKTILHGIIRDADLLQFTDKNFIQQIILGLSKELNKKINIQLIHDQLKFMDDVERFITTRKGLEIYFNNITHKQNECKMLLNVLSE